MIFLINKQHMQIVVIIYTDVVYNYIGLNLSLVLRSHQTLEYKSEDYILSFSTRMNGIVVLQ